MDVSGTGTLGTRRRFLQTLGAAGLGGIAGCNHGPDGRGTVRLEYVDVSGMRTKEAFQPVIDQLNGRFDATIELEFIEIPYENLQQKLLTRIGGGNAPDIAAIDQIWLGSFIDGGNLMPLTEIADQIDFDDYLDPFSNPVIHEGDVFGFPISTDVRGTYWNRRQFEAAGLDPEQPPETWSELFDMAGQLHAPPEAYATVYFVVSGRWTVNLFQSGGAVLDGSQREPRFHESPGVQAARFVDELYNERDISPPDPPYQNGAQVARQFLQGHHAITVIEGSWLDFFWENLGRDPVEMEQRFGFAPVPHPSGGRPATMSGGFVWTGFDSTEHPDVVREFLRIAATKTFKRHLAIESKSIPTRQSLLDDDAIWDQILYSDTVKSMLEMTETRPVRHWSVVEESLNTALQQVAFDRAEPSAALNEAAVAVREKLDSSR